MLSLSLSEGHASICVPPPPPPPPVYVLVCTRRYALPPARQIPELTLLLHVVASSSPLRRAQKTVSRAIDGALKSYILICVRWYSPINILSGVHGISRSLLPRLHPIPSRPPPLLCFLARSVPSAKHFQMSLRAVRRACVHTPPNRKKQKQSVKRHSRRARRVK